MASNSKIVLRTDILAPETRRAFEYFSGEKWLRISKWYLAGGTALALQVGHRKSIDLDFFTREKLFRASEVLARLPEKGWRATIAKDGTVYGELFKAKVSFISYPFFLPAKPFIMQGSLPILDATDIAAMKIVAISQRGRKRDFVDLFWHAKHKEPLEEIISRLPAQYPSVAHDFHHILKSMMYFEDAEEDPMPKIFFNADWKMIKKYFEKEIPKIAKKILAT